MSWVLRFREFRGFTGFVEGFILIRIAIVLVSGVRGCVGFVAEKQGMGLETLPHLRAFVGNVTLVSYRQSKCLLEMTALKGGDY